MLLAIDTSAGTSAAVVADGRILARADVADTMRHAEMVGVLIAQVLAGAGVSPDALDAVAYGVGPGPFTGLRVGIAAAQAFAFGAGLELLPVVSHDAIALTHFESLAASGGCTVTTDARRRERYWSSYSGLNEQGIPLRSAGPALAKPTEVPTELPVVDVATVSAAALGVLAERLQKTGSALADPEPLYLRSPDVTLSTGRKRVTR